MNLKQFVKPNWRNIVLFFILFGIGIFVSTFFNKCTINGPFGCYDTILGLPLDFYVKRGWPPNEMGKITFSIMNLIVDVIFWYLLSCLIIWIYNEAKKR